VAAVPTEPDAVESEIDARVARVRAGDRTALARAITLIESRRPADRAKARRLVERLLPFSGGAMRVGITGAPGVGKSTMIDTLGSNLTAAGNRVAVLAVDPSSSRTGGSVLGDKTRMARLSTDPNAFIRPSPSSGTLGGVAAKTRETLLLCEAAGFNIVLVETVGIGQSETAVADMTDFFLVLIMPGAGDELQGIKKGVLELADLIAVNKMDNDRDRAEATAGQYRAAVHLLQPSSPLWAPTVVPVSGLENSGLDEVWNAVTKHHAQLQVVDAITTKRRAQQIKWMWSMLEEKLHERLRTDPQIRSRLPEIEAAVGRGLLSPENAAETLAALIQL
jgi:LAO/AO transport system kinase